MSVTASVNRTVHAFSLVELLTVIAIVAVLASLTLTALMSAKKKSREVICVNNLHQFSLAANVYLDDFNERPDVGALVTNRYLNSGSSLVCPEDKTAQWGQLLLSPPQVVLMTNLNTNVLSFSYAAHPLVWDLTLWDRFVRSGGTAGLAACQLHGLGNQNISDIHDYSGVLLRAQLDGAVVRPQLFWNPSLMVIPIPGIPASTNTPYLYPLPVYVDNPAQWLQNNP